MHMHSHTRVLLCHCRLVSWVSRGQALFGEGVNTMKILSPPHQILTEFAFIHYTYILISLSSLFSSTALSNTCALPCLFLQLVHAVTCKDEKTPCTYSLMVSASWHISPETADIQCKEGVCWCWEPITCAGTSKGASVSPLSWAGQVSGSIPSACMFSLSQDPQLWLWGWRNMKD